MSDERKERGTGSQRRMVRRWVVVVIALIAWGTGHWMGYWYGRTKELYESGKMYGAVAADVTWEQWLKRK